MPVPRSIPFGRKVGSYSKPSNKGTNELQQPTNPTNEATRLGDIAGEALRPPLGPLPLILKEIKALKQPRKVYYLPMAPSSSKYGPRTDMTLQARYISTNFYRTPESIQQCERIAGEALRPPPRPLPLIWKEIKATKRPRKVYYLGMAPSSSKLGPRTDMTSRARYISTSFYQTPESVPQCCVPK